MKRGMLFALVLGLSACGTKQAPAPAAAAVPPDTTLQVPAESQKLAGIELATVQWETMGNDLQAPGLLTWNEDRSWSVGVVAAGKVLQTMARVGDRVEKDQILARMHTHDVHDTKASLRQARVERQRAGSQLELAKRNAERYRRLYALKTVSTAQLEQAEADVRNAEAAMRRSEAEVDRETQHLTEVLEIPADDGAADHQHAPGQHDEDELVPIKSSAKGTVVERKISVGSVVTLGQPAFVVADPESLWLLASFPERALPHLRPGQQVEIEVQAYPGQIFPGRIERLGETMDRETRTLQVRVTVAAQGRLKPEMYATVRMRGLADRALTVPVSALQDVDGESCVFVSLPNGRFAKRKVSVRRQDGRAVVLTGLREGERVAAQGSYMLKSQLLQAGE